MAENIFDPLAPPKKPIDIDNIQSSTRKQKIRQKIAKSPSLKKVQETTRLRRGRAKPIPSLIPTPMPVITPEPDPFIPDPLPVIIAKPPPAPITKPIPPPDPFAIVGNTKFSSKSDFESAKKIFSPCGDSAPFAVEHTGQQRKFCTFGDFSDAGYKLPSPLPRKTRGKLCPPGETYWGTKCKKISFSESTFF